MQQLFQLSSKVQVFVYDFDFFYFTPDVAYPKYEYVKYLDAEKSWNTDNSP